MSRHEVKLVGVEADLPRVLAELRLLPGAPSPLYAGRHVQSVYLDTADGQALQDNLAGISRRRKLRFRWYGDQGPDVLGQLEWKRRENLLGDKDTVELLRPVRVEGAPRRAFHRALLEQVSGRWRERLAGRDPVQWIRYDRTYHATADRRLRITIDTGLRATDLRFGCRISSRAVTPLPRLMIVEIKAAAEHGDDVERWVQSVGLPRSKCSKFVLASQPGEGPIPSRYS